MLIRGLTPPATLAFPGREGGAVTSQLYTFSATTWPNRRESFSCWRPIWFSEYKFLLKFCLKDPLWLHIDHKDALVSVCSDTRATSHPTRTVTFSLAPAVCKGENTLLPSEYLFPNQKALHVQVSPLSSTRRGPTGAFSKFCVEKQNQTKFKMASSSVSPGRKHPGISECQE